MVLNIDITTLEKISADNNLVILCAMFASTIMQCKGFHLKLTTDSSSAGALHLEGAAA